MKKIFKLTSAMMVFTVIAFTSVGCSQNVSNFDEPSKDFEQLSPENPQDDLHLDTDVQKCIWGAYCSGTGSVGNSGRGGNSTSSFTW